MAEVEIGRLGNLNGNWGYSSNIQGLAIGQYAADQPNMIYDSSTGNLTFSIYDTPYLSLQYNSGTPRVWLGGSVNAVEITSAGLNVGSSGNIRGGQTAFRTGSGFWMGYDSAYKFSIGNYSTNQFLDWDGTTLTVSGTINVSNGGTIGNWAITTNTIQSLSTGAGIIMDSSIPVIRLTDGTYNRVYIGKDGSDYGIILRDESGNIILQNDDSDKVLAGWNIDSTKIYKTNAYLSSSGYVSFGLTPPTSYGNNVGTWIGYSSGAKLSLYSDVNNYLQWDGSNLNWRSGDTSLISGNLQAKNAVISGTITTSNISATGGTIGSWIIESNLLKSTNLNTILNSAGSIILGELDDVLYLSSAADPNYLMWAGNLLTSSAAFKINKQGALTANAATINGSITAISGSIGNWAIGSTTLTGGTTNIILDSSNKAISINNATISGTGIQLQYNSGTPRAYIGNGLTGASARFFSFDGTNTSFKGTNTELNTAGLLTVGNISLTGGSITGGTISGWTIDSSKIYNSNAYLASAGYISFGTTPPTSYGNNIGAWLGYDSLAKLSLYANSNNYFQWNGSNLNWKAGDTSLVSGNLQAKNAVVSGTIVTTNITATGGTIGGWNLGATSLTAGSGGTTVGLDSGGSNPAIYAGSATPGSAPFRVTNAGVLTSTNATITGSVTASSGAIGGWALGATSLTAGSGGTTVGLDSGGSNPAIYAGSATPSSAPFRVSNAGVLVSTSATITGSITATTGVVGGWTLSTNKLSSTNISIDSNTERIYSNDYVSGVNGTGFLISQNLFETSNISARGIIRTAVFEKDSISSVGGTLSILDSDVLISDMSALDSAHIIISGTSTFSTNDVLRIKNSQDDEWFTITGVSGNDYTVTRDRAGSYSANTNPTWKKGATVVNYGVSGEGGILLTSSLTNSPYTSIFTHAGSPWSTITERARLGNLTGIDGASGYGLWTDNGFFTGTVSASTINTSTLQTATSGQRIVIDSNTNTVKFYDTGGNLTLTIDDNIDGSYAGMLINNGIIRIESTTNDSFAVMGRNGFKAWNQGFPSTVDTELEIIRLNSYNGDGDDAILKLVNSAPISTSANIEPDGIRYYQGPDRGEYTNISYGTFRVRYDGSLFIDNVSGTAIDVYDGPIILNNSYFSLKAGNQIRFYDADNSNYVAMQAPSLSANSTWTLPTSNVAGYLYNGGTGTLSWSTTVPVTDATNTWSAAQLFQAGFCISASVSTNSLFDDSSNGSGSTTEYIGNASINVTSSDKRYKDIQGKTRKGIKLLDKLEVIDYIWKESHETIDRKQHIGLAAQDIYEIDKCLAKKPDNEETGLWITSHDDLIALCIKSIQDLHKEIKILKKENKQLKSALKSQ